MKDINKYKPQDAIPIPLELIGQYGSRISDVWWFAKGREEDPSIGLEIDGVRKTFGGYVWNEWWYFLKPTHYNKDKTVDYSWYRKKKVPDPDNEDDFITLEEYVGSTNDELVDPDTNKEIDIPPGLKHEIKDLVD